MLDLSLGKVLVIGVLALLLVGPERLPRYAAELGRWVRVARGLTEQAKQRMASELGPGFDDVDWAGLDPRRYHPRRLLLDAWNAAPTGGAPATGPGSGREPAAVEASGPDLLLLAEDQAEAEAR